MYKRLVAVFVIIVLFIIGFYFGIQNKKDSDYKRSRILLGTLAEVIIRYNGEKEKDYIINQVFAEISRIDTLFSSYIMDNPIDKINRAPIGVISIDTELYNLLVESDSLFRTTAGMFDVSLGSLINLWGFDTKVYKLPAKEQIDSVMELIGWEKIELSVEGQIKKKGDVKLDLGAIAKGYAVDRATEMLERLGVGEYLVNIGGEIRAKGRDWTVGVQNPEFANLMLCYLTTDNADDNRICMATSGNYENYFESNGKRYHHILDNRTGFPSEGMRSITVLADNVTFADGLATGLFLMGEEEALRLVEKLDGVECMIVNRDGEMKETSGFNKFVRR